jgi:hypothetical protein
MITKEEYEEAQEIVWQYEDQLKNNSSIVTNEGCPICHKRTIKEIDNCGICSDE